MTQTRILILAAVLFWPFGVRAQMTDDAILEATAAMQAAVPRAQADPWHPLFHVTSPAQWMNDPNGPVFYHGWYHLFYQLTPFSDQSGIKYWGHVRSHDLVKWEPQPIALWPSTELGEESIWSGCCTINGEGQPMAFYTSIGRGKSAFDQAAQWAALGDGDLITWKKSSANPVLSNADNDGTNIYDWRDPFIFHDGQKTFLVLGGHLARNGDAAVNIYEALNSALTKWKYRGVLFHIPGAPTAECPNFFQLDHQWVLFVSPYGRVQYFVGDFDATTCRFHPRSHGFLDHGSSFYAPNTMQVPDGRRLVWGWLNGFPQGHGWNGCLSLPRQLSLSSTGDLLQRPAPQLAKLRGRSFVWRNVALQNGHATFALPRTNTLEILAQFSLATTNLQLTIQDAKSNAPPITINFGDSKLQILDSEAPLKTGLDKLILHIFIDRSVLEVFANDSICITKIISPLGSNPVLKIHTDDSAILTRLRSWPIKTIW
jgi:beta-fructofuranosidase